MISICLTFKNRSDFLSDFLYMLKYQDYDLKQLEICLSVSKDSIDKDNIKTLIDSNYKRFYQISYMESDRSKLPFKIIANPTCDINSQICNQPIFNKVIRTDPEILFLNCDLLNKVEEDLEIEEKCLWFASLDSLKKLRMDEFWSFQKKYRGRDSNWIRCRYVNGFFCVAFNRSKFIEYGGIDEKFAIGFCAEDTFFQWNWSVRYPYELVDISYDVIHNYHGIDHFTDPLLAKLRYGYSVPLMEKYMMDGRVPNSDCPDWNRSEMITERKIFKE